MRRRFIVIAILLCAGFGVGAALQSLRLRPFPLGFDFGLTLRMPDFSKWRTLALTPTTGADQRGEPIANRPLALVTPSTIDPGRAGDGAAKIAAATPAKPAKMDGNGVKLDVARISTDGPSVFAGTSAPFAVVAVQEDATTIATVKANESGEWSLVTEHKFGSANPRINLRTVGEADQIPESPGGNASARDAGVHRADAASAAPAARLIKEFETVVAAARADAKQHDRTGETQATGEPQTKADSPPSMGPSTGAVASSTPSITATQPPAASVPVVGPQQSSTAIPVPITFVYNEATLTDDGRRAAALLLEYVTLKRFSAVDLSGHADERGTQEYNMDLSRERLETVLRALRDGGFKGKVDLLPQGKSEPYTGVDRSKYAHDDLMQLDRRVELRVAR